MERITLWSCGGGRQSAGIAAMILLGKLPKPDHVAMVEIEWEIESVWPYVAGWTIPAMQSVGIPFSRINRKAFATHDFWGGADGDSILLPVFSDKSGTKSKLPEYCSGEWKRDVLMRWAASQVAAISTAMGCYVQAIPLELSDHAGPEGMKSLAEQGKEQPKGV